MAARAAKLICDMPPGPSTFRFGSFELDPSERRLTSGGESVALGARAFDVLLALVERGGQLVTKEALFQRAWPRLVVEENNLQVQISTLRKILGAEAIETVSGSGYRFRVAVESVAAREPPRRKDNLPPELTAFVGRELEVSGLRERLRTAPIVTIVGVGGLGKSRLAMHVAAQAAAQYEDGAWWVDLAPVADAANVPHAVADALGVTDSGDVLDSIVAHVAKRHLLVVLDNCEHVLAACARLATQLLRHAPRLTILATSREALHAYGEAIHALSPLALPAVREPSLDALLACESARLFIDRAESVSPGFRVEGQDVAHVAEICRRLDGIPLAIELAAARVRALSLGAIAQRLGSRFALLTRGDRTALPRQQTLRAMIDWSYDLLAPAERVVLARLSVFAGGCALEDAEAVAAGGAVAAEDVLDLVSNLIDKSLVVHDAPAARYRMLDTIREYAQERLAQSGEEEAVHDRHAAHYLAFAKRAEVGLREAHWLEWMAKLGVERDNFLAAHAWCGRAGRTEQGFMLLDALRMWWFRSSLELGTRIAREALAWPSGRTRGRCLAVYAAACIAYYAGRHAETVALGEECLAIAREIGDPAKAVDALIVIGISRTVLGEREAARAALTEALARARELDDTIRTSDALVNLAEFYTIDGDPALAIPLIEENIALVQRSGQLHARAINLCNLARNHLACGARSKAVPLLREVGSRLDPALAEQTMQLYFVVCAGLAAVDADWERAARLYGAAEMDLAQRKSVRERAEELFLAPLVARAREQGGSRAFDAAAQAGRELTYAAAMAEIEGWLAALE